MADINDNTTKNIMPYALVVSALIVAGAVIFTGVYLRSAPGDIDRVLEEGGGGQASVVTPEEPEYDIAILQGLAQCLTDNGMKFYGADWCGWCKRQKELFGEAVNALPYIECVDEETQEMTAQCQEVGISSFPTWISADGTKSPGYKSIEDLAQLSGCEL